MARYIAIMLVATYAFWAGAAYAVCDRVYSISHSGDYVPYQYKNDDGDLVGLDVEIVKAVMLEMGCEIDISEIPPKRAQRMLLSGRLDLMAAASITPQRQEYAYFSIPYRDERVVMFVLSNRYKDYKGLTLRDAVDEGYRIAAGVGGWYGVEYGEVKDRAMEAGLLELNTSTAQRIRMLLASRVDIVVADLYVGYHHAILEGRAADIKELPHVLNQDPVHFMLSRKTHNAGQVERFNDALSAVMQSDAFRRLLQKYIPKSG